MEMKAKSTVSNNWKMILKHQFLHSLTKPFETCDNRLRIMYFWMPLPIPFLKQLMARFLHRWGARKHCFCMPGIHHCLGIEGCCWNIERVVPSIIVVDSPAPLGLRYWYHWNVQVLTNLTCLYALCCSCSCFWFIHFRRQYHCIPCN